MISRAKWFSKYYREPFLSLYRECCCIVALATLAALAETVVRTVYRVIHIQPRVELAFKTQEICKSTTLAGRTLSCVVLWLIVVVF